MPRTGWWRTYDGSAINLDNVVMIEKEPSHLQQGRAIRFTLDHATTDDIADYVTDVYPDEKTRDKAYAGLMRCLPLYCRGFCK